MFSLMMSSILIGLSVAAPVGPIGVLCIRRTLAEGRMQGLASGLGAATADGFYGFVAAFGLTAVSALLIENAIWLRIFGGLFLLYLGIKTLREIPVNETAEIATSSSFISAYGSTFALTITNPMTILAFLGIFAGLGAEVIAENRSAAIVMVSGVFVGSALWWLALSGGVSLLRERITTTTMLWINRTSGLVITAFALRILIEIILP